MTRALFAAFGLLLAGASAAQAVELSRYASAPAAPVIARTTREAIAAHFAHRPYTPPKLTGWLNQPQGVFVTYSRHGVTRGCWGTLVARQDSLLDEVATNAVKALSLDYRQPPIRPEEIKDLVAHVSIIGPLEPIERLSALRPRHDGLFVASGAHGGALVPGEALTAAYALWACRRKAGLRAGARIAMYKFSTAVVGPIPLSP